MPVHFLSDAERTRLSRFPDEIGPDDLNTFFTLSSADHQHIQIHRRPAMCLGVALQLCALRFLGFSPADLNTAPSDAVLFLANQLAVPPETLADTLASYAQREQTRTEQWQQVQQYLGYRVATQADLDTLTTWLIERAQEHDKPTVLFQMATEKLRTNKIVRPGVTILERIVASARERAYKETLHKLQPLLAPERRSWLDSLLVPNPDDGLRLGRGPLGSGRTRFEWLKGRAKGNTPKAVLAAVARITYLREQGVGQWDVSAINLNRCKFLARLGKKTSSWALNRAPDYRRYPILIAFLYQTLEELIDEILDLFDRYLADADSTARQKLDEFRRSTARATNEKVILFEEVGEIVLNPEITDAQLRHSIHEQISPEKMRVAVDECKRLRRPVDDNYYDFLAECYPTLRQFTPAMLSALTFRSNRMSSPLLEAVQYLHQLNAQHKRKVPVSAPMGFVPSRWHSYLRPISPVRRERREPGRKGSSTSLGMSERAGVSAKRNSRTGTAGTAGSTRTEDNNRAEISRRYYELCVLCELRIALRAGNIWVEGSRRYADPESYLMPQAEWRTRREEVCTLLGAPVDGNVRLKEHQQSLTERIDELAEVLDLDREEQEHGERAGYGYEQVRLEEGELVISPLEAEDLPPSTQLLEAQVAARLPRLELADLVVEVDGWTHFTNHFTHAAGTELRTQRVQEHLYAVLLAQACNLSLHEMEHITEFSPKEMAWCANWYLRDDTLRPAIVTLVNHQHRQPLSQAWGGGTLSSSDGQRFPVGVPSRHARPLPRYFAYREEGVTFYTWTGDQWPQYGTKVTPVTARDAAYVLDEILDNETELTIAEHTTDTSGYTEMLFATFALLGLQFAPRIRDLEDQRLYRLPGMVVSPEVAHLAPLFKGTINTGLILEHWDEMLRLAGSLKLGLVSASLMLGKLQTVPRKNMLAKALQEYGRLVKTLFILRYLKSPEYRHRIERQLNKGEELHKLRRFLFFGNLGRLRKGEEEEQTTQAQSLTLVTNAVVVWNTVYMAAVLDELRAEGYEVLDEDVKHLSPARYEHINPHGKYQFNLERELGRRGLRQLRRPAHAPHTQVA
jgi:TnpA family transposase